MRAACGRRTQQRRQERSRGNINCIQIFFTDSNEKLNSQGSVDNGFAIMVSWFTALYRSRARALWGWRDSWVRGRLGLCP